MRLLVCGSRHWHRWDFIFEELTEIHRSKQGPITLLIHGACRGADVIAATWAKDRGIQTMAFHADWKKKGRIAGPIRNQEMLDVGKPNYVLAFHPDLSKSLGTVDMIKRTRAAGLAFRVVSGKK